jgi:hypothetical protein
MRQRFSRPGAALASAALLIGSAIAVLGAGPADAAPARAKRAAVAAKAPAPVAEPKAAYTKAGPDEDAGCFSARRKLFVDGEGWIVRRVTTCR